MSVTSYPEVTRVINRQGEIWSPETATTNTAFGEPIAVPITPVFQLDGLYGLPSKKFQTFTASTGSVSGGLTMKCQTGTGAYGYGVIRSRRVVRYRPGQGALSRFTAQFSAGTSGYTQRAGFFQQEQALMIGYDGTQFGVLRQNGGKAHIAKFTITAAASGAETITVTLNGTAFNVNVTATTIAENAAELGMATYNGWTVEYNGTQVLFLNNSVGVNAGSFSITSTGTLAATYSVSQTGVAHTDNWTYQANFNLDKLDGTGPSGMTIDPSKLNVYQIDFRWLGVGVIAYAIENQADGKMIHFHKEHYTNQNTTPHIDNPSFRVGYVAADVGGGGGTNITVQGGSMMGAIEGVIAPSEYPVSVRGVRTTNLTANTYGHLLTVKNRLICEDKVNTREVILKKVSAGAVSASSAPCTVFLYLDATWAANLTYNLFADTSVCSTYSTTETTITHANFTPLTSFNITSGAPQTIDVSDLRIIIPPNSRIGISIVSTGLLTRAEASLTFIED